MLSFLLNPLYVDQLPKQEFADVSIAFAGRFSSTWFFPTEWKRLFSASSIPKTTRKKSTLPQCALSIFWSSLAFLVIALLYRKSLADWGNINVEYVTYTIWILALDALVIIPFLVFVLKRPLFYAVIKIGNVLINVIFNLFFLLFYPNWRHNNPDGVFSTFYYPGFEVGYIFISNLIASLATFVVLSPDYFKLNWKFDWALWRKMMNYGFPILLAGLALRSTNILINSPRKTPRSQIRNRSLRRWLQNRNVHGPPNRLHTWHRTVFLQSRQQRKRATNLRDNYQIFRHFWFVHLFICYRICRFTQTSTSSQCKLLGKPTK